MRLSIVPWIMTLATATACGTGSDGEAFDHQIDDARQSVGDLRDEVDAHLTATTSAAELTALQAQEAPYHDGAGGPMGVLDHVVGDMHMCDIDDDDRLDMMGRMHDSCRVELDRHRDTIAAATALDEAMAEEQAHHAAMLLLLESWDETLDAMDGDDAEVVCHHHHGIHDHHGG